MIWGKFDKDKKKSDVWYPWYAWYPVELEDGRICWRQWIERKQIGRFSAVSGVRIDSYYKILPVKKDVLHA